MGLRCSILGHTFDETEVRRDRRERGSGNEVVTVVSQVEQCSRCGTERVVSENKEVVSVVDADEVGLEGGGHADAEPDPPDPDGVRPGDPEPSEDREPGSPERSVGPEGRPPEDAGVEPDPPVDPDEEDVEFITGTEGSLGGGEDVAEDVPSDADEGGGIGGMAARSGAFDGADDPGDGDEESVDEDAEIIDAPESERPPGQWPDDPEGEGPWEPDALEEASDESPETTADPAPEVEPAAEPSFTVPEGSLMCPDCGHEVSADSSFRAGDACPECQGYLEDAGE